MRLRLDLWKGLMAQTGGLMKLLDKRRLDGDDDGDDDLA